MSIERILYFNKDKNQFLCKIEGKHISESEWKKEEDLKEEEVEEIKSKVLSLSSEQQESLNDLKIPDFELVSILGESKSFGGKSFRKVVWKDLKCSTFEPLDQIFGTEEKVEKKKKKNEISAPPKETKKRKREVIELSEDNEETKKEEKQEIENLQPKKKKLKLENDGNSVFQGILIREVEFDDTGKLKESKIKFSNIQDGKIVESQDDDKWIGYKEFKRKLKRVFIDKNGEEEEEEPKKTKKKKTKRKKRKKKGASKPNFIDIDEYDDND